MGPILEEPPFLPQKSVQVGCVVVSESTPEDNLMTWCYCTDRI